MNDDRLDHIGAGGRYYGPPPPSALPPPPIKIRRKPRQQTPQATVNQFWDRMNSRFPGKVFTVLPNNPYARKRAQKTPHGTITGQRAAKSYEEARAECERDVDRIIKECRRLNQKYRDTHFDIEWDLKSGQRNCLDGLSISGESMKPKGVKRVTDIFENPQFYINGPTAGDVRQGRDGDCYLMAALCGLGNMEGLIDKVCVKHEQKIGVYGFVFFRDGEWQHTITDDKLYLRAPDYAEAQDERVVWDDINRVDSEQEYRKTHQTGSRALYFAQCSDENETWLPLLEKAYAKAHGDFASIDGGFTGEAIEDLTGGVTTEIYSTDILDKDAFWRDELMHVGKEFLFGCATGFYSNWLDTSVEPRERDGISEGHAYSIMDAKEIKGQRLLKLRNPWGRKEWTGKWSDGSSEWTPEWMQLLDHKFGNDGIFWISYEDLLRNYQHFDRTRIFGPEWNVTQCWTNVNVSWAAEYHSTKFSITLAEKAPVVIVLAQLDDTYFGGLEGGYGFDIQFRLESDAKEDENDYIVRSNGNYAMARSVSTDIELDAGTYSVLVKITATRNPDKEHLEDVLPMYAATRREKLIQMGLSYDLAHAKGLILETEAEKQERKAKRKERKAKQRRKMKEKMKEQALKHWKKGKERHLRDKHRLERKERADAAHRRGPLQNGQRSRRNPNGLDAESPENAGSMDVQKPDSPQRELDESGVPDGKRVEVLRIKSFSGEDIIVKREVAAQDKTPTSSTKPDAATEATTKTSPAEEVVQSLEEVIKQVDAETATSKAGPVALAISPPADTADGIPSGQNEPVEEKPPMPIVQVNGVDAVTDVRPLPNLPPLSQPEELSGSDDSKPAAKALSALPDRPQRSDTLDTTGAVVGNGQDSDISDEQRNIGSGAPRHPPFDDNPADVSDADSFPSFDWNTDLDMPSDSDSSTSSAAAAAAASTTLRHRHGRIHAHHRHHTNRGNRPIGGDGINSPPPGLVVADGGPRATEDGPDEPWNAVCVVGLRVYSTLAGDGVTLRVVRPKTALLDDGDSDGCDDDDDDGAKAPGPSDLLVLPARRNTGDDIVATLDPDDMARGAVAVSAEATAHVVGADVADAGDAASGG